jgi:adenylate cyclase
MKMPTILIFTYLFLFLSSCFSSKTGSPIPLAQDGVLDLRNYDFQNGSLLRLKGEWKFYPNQIFLPKDWKSEQNTFEYDSDESKSFNYSIPGTWNGKEFDGKKMEGVGYGTYRLKIILDDHSPELLGFRTMEHATAFAIWVNGEKRIERGFVSKDPSVGRGYGGGGYFYILTKDNKELDIILQISNYHHRKGGVWHAPYIGEVHTLNQFMNENQMVAYFAIGSFIIMGVYHLILSVLPPRNKFALLFSFFTLLVIIRTAVTQEKIILKYWESLDYTNLLRIEYISFYLTPAVFFHFLRELYTKYINLFVLKFVYAMCISFSIFILLTPSTLFTYSVFPFQILILPLVVYALITPVRDVINGNKDSYVLMTGMFFLSLAILHDIMRTHEFLQTDYAIPFGMIVFVFSQAVMLSIQFTRSFITVRTLSESLKNTNRAFSRFVPNQFLEFLDRKDITEIELGDSTEKEMTVLFCDIRSFTTLSESMTPTENFRFINSYLNRMGPIIRKHNGFIDKYIGDAIMALFPGSPWDALQASVEMHKELKTYNEHRKSQNYLPINIGIGLHKGRLMLGTIGEHERMEGTVISDAVNIASRLEKLAAKLGAGIIASQSIISESKESAEFKVRNLKSFQVKGKMDGVDVYEIIVGDSETLERVDQTTALFNQGLELFHKKRFSEAKDIFASILKIQIDKTVSFYFQECEMRLQEESLSNQSFGLNI